MFNKCIHIRQTRVISSKKNDFSYLIRFCFCCSRFWSTQIPDTTKCFLAGWYYLAVKYFWYSSALLSHFSSALRMLRKVLRMLRNLKVIHFGTLLIFLLGEQVNGKTYVKLLFRFENTSKLIVPYVILSFRSKNSNLSSPPTCIVNFIFPLSFRVLSKASTAQKIH